MEVNCPYCGKPAIQRGRVCVACGKTYPSFEHVPDLPCEDHHCDPERIASIEARRKAFRELGRQVGRSYGYRLAEGFRATADTRGFP